MVTKEYDIIIVGGGINSLTAAALLAKKNKSILLLESRDESVSYTHLTLPTNREV